MEPIFELQVTTQGSYSRHTQWFGRPGNDLVMDKWALQQVALALQEKVALRLSIEMAH
jgi:hypothetical protein